MIQSTMELAEERFVEEKNTLMRAHEEEKDRWQIELSTEKELLDQELKSMQVYTRLNAVMIRLRPNKQLYSFILVKRLKR